ncbi:MAG TPA: SdpI family protein [Anaerolineae bacterium]|nr:SdpI family protein [Anaerolineae bacterium]
MTDPQILLALYVASGLLLVALSIPMIRGRVKPNWIYGFKVRKTVENPDIWYPANAYAGKWLLGCGVLTVVAAGAFYFIPDISVNSYSSLCAIVLLGALTIAVWMSFRYLRTL